MVPFINNNAQFQRKKVEFEWKAHIALSVIFAEIYKKVRLFLHLENAIAGENAIELTTRNQ